MRVLLVDELVEHEFLGVFAGVFGQFSLRHDPVAVLVGLARQTAQEKVREHALI